jgi:hypothetical protein
LFGHLVYFVVIYCIITILVHCIKKNLATLVCSTKTQTASNCRMMEEERKRQLERMSEQLRPALTGEPTTLHPPVDCLITAWDRFDETPFRTKS